MTKRNLIAHKFGLDDWHRNGWQPVHCPFHNDTNASAAINFDPPGRFICAAGCDSRSLNELYSDLKGVKITKKQASPILSKSLKLLTDSKHKRAHTVSHQADALSNFLESRRLSMKTVSDLGGELVMSVRDPMYGYLVFPIQDGGRVGRKILAVDGPRFLTYIGNKMISNNLKGLLGLENVPAYNDLILTEGLTDHLTLKELGYGNTVCSLGAGISDYQGYLLRGKTVYILYDRDYTGAKKSESAKRRLGEWKGNGIKIEIPARFGSNIGKIDVSSAYVAAGGREFKAWLDEEIAKTSDSDAGYISLIQTTQSLEYFPTGIGIIDQSLEGGFTQGLYGLGGETSVGKSTIAVVLARAFVRLRKKVLYETYELPKRQVWARYASGFSDHNWVHLERDPSLIEMNVLAQLEADSNYLKVASDQTIEEFMARARHYGIIIVDYLQSMPGVDAKDVNNAIRLNNQMLRNLSMQGKTVIILSSMPRSAYGGGDDDLIFKGSGDIEYSTQANIKITKVGEGRIFLKFTKNTRGQKLRGFLDTDWQHQLLKETDTYE